MATITDPIAKQNAEFAAVEDLLDEYKRLVKTPVVDDDYPKMRHYYEGAVRRLIEAFKQNGRICK